MSDEYEVVFGTGDEAELTEVQTLLTTGGCHPRIQVNSQSGILGVSAFGLDIERSPFEILVTADEAESAAAILDSLLEEIPGSAETDPASEPEKSKQEITIETEGPIRKTEYFEDRRRLAISIIASFFHLYGFGTIAAFDMVSRISTEHRRMKLFGYTFVSVSYLALLVGWYLLYEGWVPGGGIAGVVTMVGLNLIVLMVFLLNRTNRTLFLILEIAGLVIYFVVLRLLFWG